MRSSTSLTIVVIFLLLAASGCSKLKARDELNKGVRAFKGGEFESAVEHFKQSIEHDPDLLTARVYLAIAFASQFVPGSPDEQNVQFARTAIGEFEKVLEVEPGNLTALGYIASLYYGLSGSEQSDQGIREFFDKAKEFRRRLIEVDPQNPENYYSIGVIDWTLAFKANMAKRAELGLRPDVPLPRRSLRQLADENSALVEEGSEMLEKAIEINPTYIDAISYLNLMYRQKADIVATSQEREEWFQRADEQFALQERLRKETPEADANGGN